VQGSGEPVILIHGFMDSLHTWNRNAGAWSENHALYAVDMLGFGCSERVRAPIYSLKQQARVLEEFITGLGLERVCLIGHSMGGAVALQYAYDFPGRVHKLVLVAPATFIYSALPRRVLRRVPRSWLRGAVGLYNRVQGNGYLGLRYAYGDARRLGDQAVRVREHMHRVRGSADALVSMSGSRIECDVPKELCRVWAPTLLVWGDRDRIVPLAHAYRHMNELCNARLEIVRKAGHLPHEEDPETVNSMVGNFLNEHTNDTST
jgi:pimeloyl-ACP methyl ester carboxylesterase